MGNEGIQPVYLDYCATTPISPEVRTAMLPALEDEFGNPSSLHSFGRAAKAAVENARSQVAQRIGANAQEIVFTSGATEADNYVLLGIGAVYEQEKGHLITSSIEHHAVLHTAQWLEKNGWQVTYLPVNTDGVIDPQDAASAIQDNTRLISLMMVNNETGTIQPIKEVGAIARRHGILFLTDAVQALGLLPVSVNHLGVDFLSLSAHKIYGPKGSGALYIREGTIIPPMFSGGPQEGTRRAGTENVPGIIGLGAAAAVTGVKVGNEFKRLSGLKSCLLNGLLGQVPDVQVNGPVEQTSPHVVSLTFPGSDGEMMLFLLNKYGLAVSMGSACNASDTLPSHVLLAMGLTPALADATIRVSFGYPTQPADIDRLLDVLPEIVEQCRKIQ
ncbi:MAG: cysteine desulfurase family protein [Anaerolineaceae bacterium]|jgi:cysteine desulfurase|nr:cysteine desulfurase family protein [Anaerolineaceae bacterium]